MCIENKVTPTEDKAPEKLTRAEEFIKLVESKIKKSEKETWMVDDHDHL